jgi:hypothetical protein
VEPARAVGVFEEYDLAKLMGRPAAGIRAFVAAHKDELFEADYRAMLETELARRSRVARWSRG